jgi:hypothetical protein
MGVAAEILEKVGAQRTLVSRLRVRHCVSDPLAARLRLENLLSAVDLRPAGLAPSAIVCVKRLRDPLPGTVRLQDYGASLPPAWQQRALDALARLVQSAARPAQEPVPASAESVIFADQSELLACLAHDWLEGGATTERWWWRSLFKDQEMARIVLRLWQDAPAHVPGALQVLAHKGRATAFVSRLSAAEASGLLRRVLDRFALPELLAAIRTDEESSAVTGDNERNLMDATETALLSRESFATRPRFDERDAPAEPWGRWVAESKGDLQAEQKCLLGISLLLRRAPTVARSAPFVTEVRRWRLAVMSHASGQRAVVSSQTKAPAHRPFTQKQLEPKPPRAPAPVAETESQTPPADTSMRRPEQKTNESDALETPRERVTAEKLIFQTEPAQPHTSAPPAVAQAQDEQSASAAAFEPARLPSAKDARAPERERSAAALVTFAVEQERKIQPPFERDIQPPFEKVVETRFGGLFYLVNLGLFLNLYGDFTQPREPAAVALDLWDFVALLGQDFLGRQIEADPVWPLLAELAGRDEREAPGKDFAPPEEWRVPPAWLETFRVEQSWRVFVAHERLLIWHPAGFLIIDAPRTKESFESQLRRVLENYQGYFTQRERGHYEQLPPIIAEQESKDVTPLRRWLARLSAYARARLRQALRLAEAEELAAILLARRASAHVTTTHVDVMFSLADLPVEVRLSGLDRDPGWVPAAGRFITFHFA